MQPSKLLPRRWLSGLIARCQMPAIEEDRVRIRADVPAALVQQDPQLAEIWSATAGPLPIEETPRILLEVLPDGKVWMRGFVGTHPDCSYIARPDSMLVNHDLPRLISELRDQVFDEPKSTSTE